jgi:hypothetical protein
MTPTLGDFLTLARRRIGAAARADGDLPPAAVVPVVAELDRLLTVMNRYGQDCLRAFDPVPVPLSAADLAVVGAAQLLDRAAASMTNAVRALPPATRRHPAAAGLREAADSLAAGRDLLSTHHDPGTTGSAWAPLIRSRPLAVALVTELAGYTRPLAILATRLLDADSRHAALPPAARGAVTTATGLLIFTQLTLADADTAQPGLKPSQVLLHNIPVNLPPPRHQPAASSRIARLCAGITATAGRLTQLTLRASPPGTWPAASGSAYWRHNALAAAIIADNCDLILHALAGRATQLRLPLTTRQDLHASASEACEARKAWQAVTRDWDTFTTGPGTPHSPIAGELDDLVLWVGRLARDHPAWTPARACTSRPRDPASLAPRTTDIAAVTSAVRHALATITGITSQDQQAMQTTVAARGLYCPARLLPASRDPARTYRYLPAPPSHVSDLNAAYHTSTTAASDATATLARVILSFRTPAPGHAIAQAAAMNPAAISHLLTRLDEPPATKPAHATPIPDPGELVRYLAKLGITDTELTLRAMTLDRASDLLKHDAATRTQARATAIAEASHATARRPAAPTRNRAALTARQDQPATSFRPALPPPPCRPSDRIRPSPDVQRHQ